MVDEIPVTLSPPLNHLSARLKTNSTPQKTNGSEKISDPIDLSTRKRCPRNVINSTYSQSSNLEPHTQSSSNSALITSLTLKAVNPDVLEIFPASSPALVEMALQSTLSKIRSTRKQSATVQNISAVESVRSADKADVSDVMQSRKSRRRGKQTPSGILYESLKSLTFRPLEPISNDRYSSKVRSEESASACDVIRDTVNNGSTSSKIDEPNRKKKRNYSKLSIECDPAIADKNSVGAVFKELRESIFDQGIWIQCLACKKWRHLPPGTDPSTQPTPWFCAMNEDQNFNDCSVAEAVNNELNDADLITAEFLIGSIVWAKTPGFPWWPAMVDIDPDSLEFYWFDEEKKKVTHYNVTYFDEKVTRAWVTLKNIKRFTGKESGKELALTGRQQNYAKQRALAFEKGKDALKLTVAERASKFGYVSHLQKSGDAEHLLSKIGCQVASPAPSADSGLSSRTSSVEPQPDSSDCAPATKKQKKNLKRSKQSPPARVTAQNDESEDDEMLAVPLRPRPSITQWLSGGI